VSSVGPATLVLLCDLKDLFSARLSKNRYSFSMNPIDGSLANERRLSDPKEFFITYVNVSFKIVLLLIRVNMARPSLKTHQELQPLEGLC
jgi:hypothetical protein